MKFAFDRSARNFDADGRMHVERSHISKAAINPYYGNEIPGFAELGLQGDKIYRLFRDPKELEKAAPTFARLPILSQHQPVTVDAPRPDLIVGAIGSDVNFNFPYLDADLCIWDAPAIAGIETQKIRELSCGYRYVPIMESGEFEGDAYDGRMTEIRGNHLALVEVGRAGADIVVADHNPFKAKAMKMTKLGKALFAALCASSSVLAMDASVPGLVGNAQRKTFEPLKIKPQLLALDASLDSNKLDAVIDAILDVEQDPKAVEPPAAAADESPAEKLKALLSGKVDEATLEAACALLAPAAAADALPEPGMKKEDVKAAMDGLRKDMQETQTALREVRAVVGDVMGMDSAVAVYGFALDHLKVDRAGVEGVASLRALYKVAATASTQAPTPRIAQDGAALEKQFPNVLRFRPA